MKRCIILLIATLSFVATNLYAQNTLANVETAVETAVVEDVATNLYAQNTLANVEVRGVETAVVKDNGNWAYKFSNPYPFSVIIDAELYLNYSGSSVGPTVRIINTKSFILKPHEEYIWRQPNIRGDFYTENKTHPQSGYSIYDTYYVKFKSYKLVQ